VTPRFLSCRKIAEWWGFTPETISTILKSAGLQSRLILGELHFYESQVEAFLARASEAQGPAPTIEDFRNGLRLLTSVEAAALLHTTPSTLSTRRHRGELFGLKLGYELRFTPASIREYQQKREECITNDEIPQVFGCSNNNLSKWERAGILAPIFRQGLGHRRNYYRYADILRAITTLLPPHTKHLAEQWLLEVSVSARPPFTTREAMAYLGLPRAVVEKMAQDLELFEIGLSGDGTGDRRFSPVSIERAFLAQEVYTPQRIGETIGATGEEVARWQHAGTMTCREHNHYKTEYRQACLVSIVTPLLGRKVKPLMWLRGRRDANNRPLVSMTRMARRYDVSEKDIVYLASIGALGGIRLPNGRWMFSDTKLGRNEPGKMRALLESRNR
jgi:hypothetical protein